MRGSVRGSGGGEEGAGGWEGAESVDEVGDKAGRCSARHD